MEIYGDLSNIKRHILEQLESIYELEVPTGQISTHEINSRLVEVTEILGRETAAYINRQGKVLKVAVGDTATISLPELKGKGGKGLSGIRCIHTHPGGDVRLSMPDLSSFRHLRFDLMAAIGISKEERHKGEITASFACFTGAFETDGTAKLMAFGPMTEQDLHRIRMQPLLQSIQREIFKDRTIDLEEGVEKALLVGLSYASRSSDWTVEESLEELAGLAETAGAEVVGRFFQKREKPDSATFLGRGKIEEIGMEAQNLDADLILVDDELTPSQQRNLEALLGLKIVDRTGLILDIFAQRARTREGKLQVELAQLKYQLPRLSGQGLMLSRLGSGIGTRGPGERKLEADRRVIRSKIHDIERQISEISKQRRLQRGQRKKSKLPMIALVGYTNAGKSTLLNSLTGSEIYAEDQLFATLDPTTRQLLLPDHREALLTDTVGFIQKLPHGLVAAFRATLEEVQEADLLLHVVDASSPHYEQQISAVLSVLQELQAEEKPTIYVFNKSDAMQQEIALDRFLHERVGVLISAKTGKGLEELKERLGEFFTGGQEELVLEIPFSEGRSLERLHSLGTVLEMDYNERGTWLRVRLPCEKAECFNQYRLEE